MSKFKHIYLIIEQNAVVKIAKSIYNVLNYDEQTLTFIEIEKFNKNKNGASKCFN